MSLNRKPLNVFDAARAVQEEVDIRDCLEISLTDFFWTVPKGMCAWVWDYPGWRSTALKEERKKSSRRKFK